MNVESELEPLVEAVKKEKNSKQKSRKDRTPEEDEEILDLMYPSMRHLGKNKVNKTDDIELYITDTYDFNKSEKSGAPAVGRDRQEKGEIKPYFAIYHVIIPKENRDIVLSDNYKKMGTRKVH